MTLTSDNRDGPAQSDYERLEVALAERYVLKREIGRGGMATVYLATETRRARSVAIKVLDSDLASLIGRQRFVREVEVMSRLDHPHIVPVFAAGEADGLLYFVMPFIDGPTVRHRLAQDGTIAPREALNICRDVAEALAHAHARGVVHRDIKPENILLARGGPVVADFGIAKAVLTAGGDSLTRTGFVIGTPRYMSPEQADGTTLDGRADIYALGRVLYEMLLGDVPPHEEHDVEQELTTIPPPAAALLRRALAPDLRDRFPSARALADALAQAAGNTRSDLRPLPTLPATRTIVVIAIAALLVAFLVISAAVIL